MAEMALSVALFGIEQVINILSKKVKNNRGSGLESADILRCRLDMMRAWLKDTEVGEVGEGTASLQEQMKQVREVAYGIEDALDEFMIKAPPHFHSHRISNIAHDFVHFVPYHNALSNLSDNMEKLIKRIDSLNLPCPKSNSQQDTGRRGDDIIHQALQDDEVIGYQAQKDSVLRLILGKNLRILSVVGPGGSGKTILVKNVIENREIKERYSRQAWIDLTPPFSLNDVLLNMLTQFNGARNAHHAPRPEGESVADSLVRCLEQEKFLVILDNIRRVKDRDLVLNRLPTGLRGSKIIVISHDSNVGSSCVESENHVVELKGLSEKDASELFSKKAFGTGGICPRDLIEWAEKIIRKCGCMPFAVSAAGCYLSKAQKIPVVWERFYNSFGTDTSTSSNLWTITHILSRSFKDLPSHLKVCFLYFSIFPENYPVERGRLIRSWIAEGFVSEKTFKTMEEVAEEYLIELIERNLVIISEKEIDGRVKTCRVLNLVSKFIVAQSKEEIFVEVLSESNPNPNPNLSPKVRHLAVHTFSANFSRQRNCCFIRSLFVFDTSISFDAVQNLCQEDRFLKTIDLQGMPLKKFPEAICNLILLRCLRLRGTWIKEIPNSIKNLVFLETLDLKQTLVTYLPKGISKLRSLRHLLVYRYNVQVYVAYDSAQGVEVSAGIENLTSLQKLSLVNVNRNKKKFVQNLRALEGLRKLGLTNLKNEHGNKLCCSIGKMKTLSTLDVRAMKNEILDLDSLSDPPQNLQRLYLKGCLNRVPPWIASLSSLIKIGLKWSKLKAHGQKNPLQILGALPNLMELDLTDFYCGSELEFETEKFKKLKILALEQFDNLHTMKIEYLAMPLLEKLTIMKCRKLKLLPIGIEGLHCLKELHLYDMPKEFIESLQRRSPDHDMVKHVRVIDSFTLIDQYPWFKKENIYYLSSNSNSN